MNIIETERLALRHLDTGDAFFILHLLNEPSFLENIGDKGVRSDDDARNYILDGPVASYERHGFGLYLVELKHSHTAIGICGLLKRESLHDVDLGFAFLPRFWRRGYAFESTTAVLAYAWDSLDLQRVVAVTHPRNAGSIRALEKLGMTLECMVRLTPGERKLKLFAIERT